MARNNKYGKGFPIDSVSERKIGQSLLYTLDADNNVVPVSPTNPVIEPIHNITDVAALSSGIDLNDSTSVVVAVANPDRLFFRLDVNGDNQSVWLKLQSASIDNDKKGIYLRRQAGNNAFWEMPSNSIYTGEICAIAVSGSPDVHITEY